MSQIRWDELSEARQVPRLHRSTGTQSSAGDPLDETQVLYTSLLKVLGNDIQKNLEQPLGENLELAGQRGLLMPAIRTSA